MNRFQGLFFICILLTSCFQRERDCDAFKTGKFSFSYTLDGKDYVDTFARKDSIEISYRNGSADTSSIRWINNCEFIVRKLNPTSVSEKKAVHIKILSTTKDSYIFEYNMVGDQKNKQKGTAVKID
ncbi:hypothetical protein [Ascidiimonas sp. W6]|uniref:hypothetical protein n=1 Tax=Ascidiimonas meishanensis TaxID=3128903 RepID=UPI0030EDC432